MDMLKRTVHLLHGQADNSLTRITRLFQDDRDPSIGVGEEMKEWGGSERMNEQWDGRGEAE